MTGENIIKTRDALKTQRSPFETHWRECSIYFTPCQVNPGGETEIWPAEEVSDTTGKSAALILANGLASLVTPREEKWFEWQPPREMRTDDEAVAWYRQCSEIGQEFIESSNFYEEIQECYIDSPVYGTAALYCGELDDRGELHFRQQRIGTYYITEDAKGRVNSFYRDLQLNAEQAKEEFGEENLDEVIKQALDNPSRRNENFSFVHAVYKRNVSAQPKDSPPSQRKPWASVTVFERDKKVVKEEGFDEFCFAVSRYRKFSGSPWGHGPGSIAKGDCRQLEFLNRMADACTEKMVFPPIKAPSTLEGDIRIGPGEITLTDPNNPNESASLSEWALAGRYDIGKDRLQDKQRAVNEAFHVDLFKLFSMRAQERAPLTATEASFVAGEKLTQFSPVYGRLVSEMLDVILTRVFGVLLRAGQFPDAPPAVQQIINGKPNGKVALPSVLYKNKIVLAQQARQTGSLLEFFNVVLPLLQVAPEVLTELLDSINLSVVIRDVGRNSGMPEHWLETLKNIAAKKEQRQAAQAQAAQMQNAEAQSKTLGNLGKLPPQALDAATQSFSQ